MSQEDDFFNKKYGRDKINEIQEKLMVDTEILSYTPEELRYLKSPLGRAILRKTIKEEQNMDPDELKKKRRLEYLHTTFKCKICGATIKKQNNWRHVRTYKHRIHAQMKNKLINAILGED